MSFKSVLVDALSGFWHRFFRDLGDFDALYEGTEAYAAQLYLDLLHETLGNSVDDAALLRQQRVQALTFTQADVRRDARGAYINLPLGTRCLRYLQDTPVAPKTVISVAAVPGDRLNVPVPLGEMLAGMASRPVRLEVAGTFTQQNPTAENEFDRLVGAGATLQISDGRAFEVLYATPTKLYLKTPAVIQAETLTKPWSLVREDGVAVRTSVSVGVFTFGVERTALTPQYSAWGLDADVDDQLLYRTLGNLLDPNARPSTEQYRSFIRGLLGLYVQGPTIKRLEAGLHAAAGFPVVRTNGERVTAILPGVEVDGLVGTVVAGSDVFTALDSVDFTDIPASSLPLPLELDVMVSGLPDRVTYMVEAVIDATHLRLTANAAATHSAVAWRLVRSEWDLVQTTRQAYEVPRGTPLAPYVVRGAVLNAMDPLTTAVNVVDYIEDPNWWHGITIPETLMPGLAFESRRATSTLFPNEIGPTSGWRVGDTGFLIGGDRIGTLPGGGYLVATVHRTPAFAIVDQYLKRNMVGVRFAPYVETTPGAIQALAAIVENARPAGTYAYVWPQTDLEDTIRLVDDLLFKAQVDFPYDQLLAPDSNWQVGQSVLGSTQIIGGTYTPTGTGLLEEPVQVVLT